MAGGNNRKFLEDPVAFLSDHFIERPNRGDCQYQLLDKGGIMNFDLVSKPNDLVPNKVELQNYDYQKFRHGSGAQPVKAFYLPSISNKIMDCYVDSRCDYLFTDNFSGCMFLVYQDIESNEWGKIKAEHMNTSGDYGPLKEHANEIIVTHEPNLYYKILSPCLILKANVKHVKTYSITSCVIGVRTSGHWEFYFKPMKETSTILKL